MLRKLLEDHQPEYIAASFDLAGPTFRDDLSADYKANRAPMPDDLAEQIPLVHEACEALGVPILTSERYEADDVIGTLARAGARRPASRWPSSRATRTSSSSSTTASASSTRATRAPGTTPRASARSSASRPGQVVDVLALMGDTIDNIKGVPGIGEKGARELIADLRRRSTHLLAHAGEITQKRYREGLLAHADDAAPEPRAGDDPDRRAGGVRPRGASLPRRLARALLRALQRAGLPHARHRVRADGRHGRARPTAVVNSLGGARGAGGAARGGAAVRAARDPGPLERPCAPRSSACRSRRRPREADYVPLGHRALGDTACLPARDRARRAAAGC